MAVCRWIVDGAASGAWNMAVDEVLLRAAAAGGGAALRFYDWEEPTLSLGYFQAVADRAQHAASRACTAVRRRSGGGAILHHHELTYSLALPCSSRWSRATGELYQRVHAALIHALRDWGAACTLAAAGPSGDFLCFQRRSEGDVLLQGHKIVGSAQRRHQAALLQHGSLLLRRSRFAPELPGLLDLLGQPAAVPEIRDRVAAALSPALGLQFEPQLLDPRQRADAAQLVVEIFAQNRWIHRR